MRTLSKLAVAGVLVAGLAGTAVAGVRSVHVMNVRLPDGTVEQVHYVGDVAPRVTLVPMIPVADAAEGIPVGFAMPGLAMPDFDAFAQIDRQVAAMQQQMAALSSQASGSAPAAASLAAYGNGLPAGTTSFSSVTYSENGHQCSRSTQVIGQGPGKAPKVSSTVSGDCGPAGQGTAVQGAAPRSTAEKAPAAAAVPDGPVHQS